jgi:hypothetical protein
MSDFVPEGYLPMTSAFDRALLHWFREPIATALEGIERDLVGTDKHDSSADPVPNHLQETIKQRLAEACREQIDQTHRDLQNALHKGEITAFYFSTTILRDEPSSIPRASWASPAAGDVIKDGIYFPFGRPKAYHERRPFEQVLVGEEELDRFLAGQALAPPPLSTLAKADTATNKPLSSKDKIAAPGTRSSTSEVSKDQGGRPLVHDWIAAAGYLGWYIAENDYPDEQVVVVEHLLTWFRQERGKAPDRRDVERCVTELFKTRRENRTPLGKP